MPTQEEILKSNEAELILNSETLQALQNLKDEYINLWLLSKESDIEKEKVYTKQLNFYQKLKNI